MVKLIIQSRLQNVIDRAYKVAFSLCYSLRLRACIFERLMRV